jgi:hypothetical protein
VGDNRGLCFTGVRGIGRGILLFEGQPVVELGENFGEIVAGAARFGAIREIAEECPFRRPIEGIQFAQRIPSIEEAAAILP